MTYFNFAHSSSFLVRKFIFLLLFLFILFFVAAFFLDAVYCADDATAADYAKLQADFVQVEAEKTSLANLIAGNTELDRRTRSHVLSTSEGQRFSQLYATIGTSIGMGGAVGGLFKSPRLAAVIGTTAALSGAVGWKGFYDYKDKNMTESATVVPNEAGSSQLNTYKVNFTGDSNGSSDNTWHWLPSLDTIYAEYLFIGFMAIVVAFLCCLFILLSILASEKLNNIPLTNSILIKIRGLFMNVSYFTRRVYCICILVLAFTALASIGLTLYFHSSLISSTNVFTFGIDIVSLFVVILTLGLGFYRGNPAELHIIVTLMFALSGPLYHLYTILYLLYI